MKIRNGFVSNSSSSSFIIIHKDSNISKEDLIKKSKESYSNWAEDYCNDNIDEIKKLANNNEYAACIVTVDSGAEEYLEKIIEQICTGFNIKNVRLISLN